MISSYRLGDLVCLQLNDTEKNELLKEHPNSFGSKYIMEKRNSNIDIITKIVLEYIDEHKNEFPTDISDSTVIHVRLGDVVAGNEWHETLKRPLKIDEIKSVVPMDTSKIYIIGKCFFCKYGTKNFEKCINLSNEYVNTLIKELNAEHFNSDNADIDLCCGVMAKTFIQGRGYFSKLIVDIRKRLNKSSIETSVLQA
jgi:hypothetical protein